jgi:RNA recognition motif-containing protein
MTTKNTTVYISNLSYERDRNGLKSMFSKFGIIKNIKIIVEPETNQSRGMAFVEMGSVEEAKKAIAALDKQIVDGRTVKASWAIPQKDAPQKTFKPRAPKSEEKKTNQKDLDYQSIQLAKKARNDARRKSNPFVFKAKSK